MLKMVSYDDGRCESHEALDRCDDVSIVGDAGGTASEESVVSCRDIS